jgi:hypothetical protein
MESTFDMLLELSTDPFALDEHLLAAGPRAPRKSPPQGAAVGDPAGIADGPWAVCDGCSDPLTDPYNPWKKVVPE